MKFVLISAALLFGTQAYSLSTNEIDVNFDEASVFEESACEAMELTEEQINGIKETFSKAKMRGKKLKKQGIRLYKAYGANVVAEDGSMERAAKISKRFSKVVHRATHLKARVMNRVLFKILSGSEQRIQAIKCLKEHKERNGE